MAKTSRGTPKRRKAKPRVTAKPRQSATKVKALERRKAFIDSTAGYVPPALPSTLQVEPAMVATFVGTLELTEKQIAALRRKVEDSEIEWKPVEKNGPPVIPYLSHNGYRDRLDAAFGLGGWGMVLVGMPRLQDTTTVLAPYAMCITGVPRVYAWGEQQMHKMTYGDALEGSKSNAIMRCGKELGIARELWDRTYLEALKHRHGKGSRPQQASDYNAKANETITEPQKIRLWTIMKKSGRLPAEFSVWLAAVYGIQDTLKIKRGDYDAIIKAIEAPGPLPEPRE